MKRKIRLHPTERAAMRFRNSWAKPYYHFDSEFFGIHLRLCFRPRREPPEWRARRLRSEMLAAIRQGT